MNYADRIIVSPRMRFHHLKGAAKAWCLLSLLPSALTLAIPHQAAAQAPVGKAAVLEQAAWTSGKATHLIGMPEAKPRQQGTLKLFPGAIVFTTQAGNMTIDRARVLSLSIGDERMERGGRMAKIARSAIPYGGGAALATMSGTQVDLLTIEFRDAREAYHGAVFLLPKDEAVRARDRFFLVPPAQLAPQPQPRCLAGAAQPSTVKIAGIATPGEVLPPEYKVLLYEHLVTRLHDQSGLQAIYRDGDSSVAAACPALTLTLTVSAFKKGNAVLRASTGPLGMFLGTTQLKFAMDLRDDKGSVLLNKELKASQRGDNESLEIADDIAKSVARKLKKANAHRPA